MNLADISLAELRQMEKDVEVLIQQKAKADLAAVQSEVLELIKARGFTIEAVLPALLAQPKQRRVMSPAQCYQHPEKADLIWRGRGPRPAWLQELLTTGGRKLDDLAIPK